MHEKNVTLSRVFVTIIAVLKQYVITCSECVFVTLVIQHSIFMRRVILSSVAGMALHYFFRVIS